MGLGQEVVTLLTRPGEVNNALLRAEPRHGELGDRDPGLAVGLLVGAFVLLGLHVVDDEELAEVAHLLEGGVRGPAPGVDGGEQLVEELARHAVVFEQEELVAEGVEDVVLGQRPALVLVDLQTLAVGS